MEHLQIFILALVQGLSEFLPISSSAHLVIISPLLGWEDQGLGFDIGLHFGTLLAVLIFCRQELWFILQDSHQAIKYKKITAGFYLGLMLALATLPIIIAGFFLKDWVALFARNMVLIAVTTLVFGLALGWADYAGKQTHSLTSMGWRQAMFIGILQILALIPGVSRSGITITAALLMGLNRTDSAKFSFLLSIPTIAGAQTLLLMDWLQAGTLATSNFIWQHAVLGGVMASVIAFVTMKFLLELVKKIGYTPFAVYRVFLGLGLFFWVYYAV